MNTVVIAHYDKPILWIDHIDKSKVNIEIYTTNLKSGFDTPVRFCTTNKGMDANMYLQFIIDNYNNLPERTLFLHHHETDWSQDFTSQFIANSIKWDADKYFNVGARASYWQCLPHFEDQAHTDRMKSIWHIFEDFLPYPEQMISYAGALFCVHRDLIWQYPLEYYEYLLKWLHDTDLPDWFTGRVFEWTWHYLFTKNPIDKQFTNQQIFNL